jgi:hypothetical protein
MAASLRVEFCTGCCKYRTYRNSTVRSRCHVTADEDSRLEKGLTGAMMWSPLITCSPSGAYK